MITQESILAEEERAEEEERAKQKQAEEEILKKAREETRAIRARQESKEEFSDFVSTTGKTMFYLFFILIGFGLFLSFIVNISEQLNPYQ